VLLDLGRGRLSGEPGAGQAGRGCESRTAEAVELPARVRPGSVGPSTFLQQIMARRQMKECERSTSSKTASSAGTRQVGPGSASEGLRHRANQLVEARPKEAQQLVCLRGSHAATISFSRFSS